MNILLDTDVLIDVALDRHPFSHPAGELLDVLEKRPGSGYIAWHSISNFYYLVKAVKGGSETKDFIRDLLHFIQVALTNGKDVLYALRLPLADFEDALQCAAAIACSADIIASRNLKDYRNSPVPVKNPDSVLKILTS
jgi:predicted nucleic acid-binding protein